MAHRRAKLTPFGRLLIVQRVLELGWTVAEAAKAAGVSRATAHKWVRRYRQEGPGGLEDRSSRARRCPHALPARQVQRILRARRRLKCGPHQLAPVVGSPRSTIYAVLRRHRMSRLAHLDRPTGTPIRYERERPGELVHVDVKNLDENASRYRANRHPTSARSPNEPQPHQRQCRVTEILTTSRLRLGTHDPQPEIGFPHQDPSARSGNAVTRASHRSHLSRDIVAPSRVIRPAAGPRGSGPA